MPQLLNIPGELIDTIISEIEEPHTLLQLAVASKQLAQDILVSHLRYRVVQCNRAEEALVLWKDLAMYPGRSRNIRSLRIGPASENAGDLLGAVAVMSGLEQFIWDGPGPGAASEALSKSLFTVLARECLHLKDVRLCTRRLEERVDELPIGALRPIDDLEEDRRRSIYRSLRWVSLNGSCSGLELLSNLRSGFHSVQPPSLLLQVQVGLHHCDRTGRISERIARDDQHPLPPPTASVYRHG